MPYFLSTQKFSGTVIAHLVMAMGIGMVISAIRITRPELLGPRSKRVNHFVECAAFSLLEIGLGSWKLEMLKSRKTLIL